MSIKNFNLRNDSIQRQIIKAVSIIILSFGAFTMIIPFLWSVITSLKSTENIFSHSAFWIQFPPDFSAYKQIWDRVPLLLYAGNTLKVALIVTFGQLVLFLYCHHDDSWDGSFDPKFLGDEKSRCHRYTLGADPICDWKCIWNFFAPAVFPQLPFGVGRCGQVGWLQSPDVLLVYPPTQFQTNYDHPWFDGISVHLE
jgi:hypothetical protein